MITSRAYEIFKSSETDRKRKIIEVLFPKLQMDGKKVVFTTRKPFNLIVENSGNLVWLPNLEEFRIFYPEINNTMQTKMYFEFENRLVA